LVEAKQTIRRQSKNHENWLHLRSFMLLLVGDPTVHKLYQTAVVVHRHHDTQMMVCELLPDHCRYNDQLLPVFGE
jgi:hypothetical protein